MLENNRFEYCSVCVSYPMPAINDVIKGVPVDALLEANNRVVPVGYRYARIQNCSAILVKRPT
jgi:hypothetical protein